MVIDHLQDTTPMSAAYKVTKSGARYRSAKTLLLDKDIQVQMEKTGKIYVIEQDRKSSTATLPKDERGEKPKPVAD